MRALAAITTALVLIAVACDGGDEDATQNASPTATIETATLTVVGAEGLRAELSVELAGTPEERSRGLSFREELAENAGMLFLFPEDTQAGFWMKDTSVPLSIAFITADGTIIDVQDMEPLTEDRHRPPADYRYALEVNRGWFAHNGFAAGDRVEGLVAAAKRDLG